MLHCTLEGISLARQGGQPFSRHLGSGKEPRMIQNLISYAQNRISKRRQYNRLADEIASLSQRDLADLRADRGEMLRHAYQKIYG